ncbi:YtxH domain-containing protein [Wansuia hejianensis]|uniref:YtxH domain-containing protein n=1 Tax=Wansuia hejianensis TaxID=2763667 RepID=A0A926EWC8_9FIRM|nr:YtxH domain-containing protein [Wansuia hejianensis]
MIGKYVEEKRKKMERERKIKTAKNVATGTIIGTTLGAIAGLLFAPKSGKEMREDITIKSKEVADNLKDTMGEKIEEAKDFKNKVTLDLKEKKEKIENKTELVSKELEEGISEIGEVIEDTVEDIKKDIE